eukprot:COSAG02_NODE_29663_length_565_cov_0.978541_2_plen_58_part_01
MPPFFCPILRDGEFTLAQTPAIMEFLGRKHGCKTGSPMPGHVSSDMARPPIVLSASIA